MSSPERYRLFVAVPVPEAARAAASQAVDTLRGAGDVRWVQPENLHLTLKFLGETPAARVPDLDAALRKSANGFSRFMVSLGGPGAFPNSRRPATLWLGVEQGSEGLARLAGAVDLACAELGFPAETRPFRAHLTLGRARSPRGQAELARRLAEAAARPTEPVAWPVTEFHLVRSVLRPAGPEYTVLHRFPLDGEPRGETGPEP